MKWIKGYALYLAWLASFVGLLISVYYGEVLNMEPCRLCWYQRIAIFPLALFLGIAACRDERRIAMYCLPLALFGLAAACYQLVSYLFPELHSPFLCGRVQCSIAGVSPFLTVGGFFSITALILFSPNTK